jgi:uncharacterized repeat protein (TIGR02543 family)
MKPEIRAVTYTVTFHTDGGSPVDSQVITEGEKAVRPDNPTKDGFGFVNWYDNEECTEPHYNFDTPVTGNIDLYAKWSDTFYTVTFHSNGGSAVAYQTVGEGGTAREPSKTPTSDGFVFSGWYSDEAPATVYDFDTPVTGNIDLYAKWLLIFTVTFDSDGGSAVPSQTVAGGEKATRPDNPTKDGFGFVNWYDNEECIEPHYDFDTPVTADITLYAKWSSTTYTVTFHSNGGSAVADQTVGEGGTAREPSQNPTRDGFEFDGWYSDEALTTVYDFDTPVTANIDLYAKWIENTAIATTTTITVEQITDLSFDDIEGGIISRSGNSYPTSTRIEYIDTGTYTCEWTIGGVGAYAHLGLITLSAANSCTVDATDPRYNSLGTHAVYLIVYKDGVPYSKTIWVTIVGDAIFTVTFNSNGGSPVESKTVAEGGTATRPDDPTKNNSYFADWYDNADLTGSHYDFDTPVTADITLHAKWSDSSYTVSFNSNDGSEVAPLTVGGGGTVGRPPNPTREHYSFENWYSDSGLSNEYDFNSPVTTDITLYAKWNPIPVSGVTLNKTSTSILMGNTETLTHTVEPSNALNQNVTWESSAPGVATVSNDGTVTAVAAGTAIITVRTTDGDHTASCTVTVTDMSVAVSGVTLNENTLALIVGNTRTLTATVQPATATNQNVTWSIEPSGVATVTNGTVSARTAGSATVTVTTADGGHTATCTVTVITINDADFEPGATITNTFNVSSTAQWNTAVTTINGNGNGTSAINKNYIINVIANFNVTGVTARTFTASYIKVSLRGAGRTLTLSGNGNLLRIGANQTVILRDLILKGNSSNDTSLVYVSGTRSAFIMQSGEISGNTDGGSRIGGGVYVADGTFTMYGGKISNNIANGTLGYGGGVYLYYPGTFTMHGGEISGNRATSYGGGVYVINNGTSGTFTMYDGKISGNTSTYEGGGVYLSGSNGTFTMHGGEISGNNVTGTSRDGGGVHVASGSTFTMHGGTISGNKVASGTAGGGGVYVTNGTFTMHDGKISGNTANGGGGVLVTGSNGTFTMRGGEIFGNTATGNFSGTGGGGGGVLVYSGTFRIVNGTIYGSNEADANLRNRANSAPGAALWKYANGTAQRGTFAANGTTWRSSGDMATSEDTVRVVNGELAQ